MIMISRLYAPILLSFALLVSASSTRAYAQEINSIYQAAIELHDSSLQPQIDGKLDDKIWLLVFGMHDFVAMLPGAEAPAVVGSDVLLAHDGEYLYIGLRAHDPKPADIRANFGRRDRIDDQDDAFTVYIALDDGSKKAQFFTINANGILADGLFHFNGQKNDFTADFEFSGAAHQDALGWTAELKIPLSQLHLAKKNWRMIVLRNYVRSKEWQLRSQPMLRTADCYLCVSNSGNSPVFWPQRQKMPLDLKTAVNEAEAAKASEKAAIKGVEISMRPVDRVMLDGSFRAGSPLPSAELPVSVSLSAGRPFASAREEDRPFFINHADLLPYLADSVQPTNFPIYTRSITDLAWGVRATTRNEHIDGVWLASLDNGGGKVMLPKSYQTELVKQPMSTVSIGHARLSLADLKIGALFSDRDYGEKGYNRVLGQDLTWQLNPRASLRAHWLHSQTTARVNAQRELEKQADEQGDAQRIEYSYRTSSWEWVVASERVSPGFRADNGFFGQAGYLAETAQVSHQFGKLAGISEIRLSMAMQDARDWQGNTLKRGWRPSLSLGSDRDTKLSLEMASNELQRTVAGGQLHNLSFVTLALSGAPARWLPQASARLNMGDKIDAQTDKKIKGSSFELQLGIKPVRQLDVKMYWLKEWLRSAENGAALSNMQGSSYARDSALQMQMAWQFDPTMSVKMVVSQGKTTRNPALYEQSLELMPFDASLSNSLSLQKLLTKRVEFAVGVARARNLGGKNDAYVKFQLQL